MIAFGKIPGRAYFCTVSQPNPLMKINFDPSAQRLEFNDGLKTQYRLILILLFLNIGIATLNLYNKNWSFSGLNILWTIIGVVAFLGVLFVWLRKDMRHRIPLNEIERLREKTFFGTRRFSLKLRNGKSRDIIGLKTPVEVRTMVELMQELGVATS